MPASASAIVGRLGGTELMLDVAREHGDVMESFWNAGARPSWLIAFAERAGVETRTLIRAACACLRVAAQQFPEQQTVVAIADASEAFVSGGENVDPTPLRSALEAALAETHERIRSVDAAATARSVEIVTRPLAVQLAARCLLETWSSREAAMHVAVMATAAMRARDEDPDVRIAPLLAHGVREHIPYAVFHAALRRTHPELAGDA